MLHSKKYDDRIKKEREEKIKNEKNNNNNNNINNNINIECINSNYSFSKRNNI